MSKSKKSATTATTKNVSRRQPSRSSKARVQVMHHDFGGSELSIVGLVDISFQRTLRVAESGVNALPPGLGMFPLRSVNSLGENARPAMLERGGVLLPMYQREAMWMSFYSAVPVAIQIASGLRCAVTGKALENRLRHRKQNFMVGTSQPWIDGFKTDSGEVRQFVAARLGDGATVEEQLSDEAPVGGVQIVVWELTDEALLEWKTGRTSYEAGVEFSIAPNVCYSIGPEASGIDMGLGAGGVIQQEIYKSEFPKAAWRSKPSARVWVHLVDANAWTALTGEERPSTPVTAMEYARHGLPWFDFYDSDRVDIEGSPILAGVATVGSVLGVADDGAAMHPLGAAVKSVGPDRRPQWVTTVDWD